MRLHPLVLLATYGVAILAAALLGMWVQNAVRLTHTRMQVAMSFVAGLILGVALYHLIPHSVVQMSDPEPLETATWWVIAGLVLMVFLLRVFRFHQHDFGDGTAHAHNDRRHGSGHASLSWLGVSLGLGMHTFTEGTALGASVRSGLDGSSDAVLVSFGMFLAIVFHKPLDSFSILGLMRISGMRLRTGIAVNAGLALLCPLAAFLTYWGIGLFGEAEADVAGRALAFGAGALLCISLSDLLPEIHFHGHDRILLTGSFLVGISLAYALHYLEHLPMFEFAH